MITVYLLTHIVPSTVLSTLNKSIIAFNNAEVLTKVLRQRYFFMSILPIRKLQVKKFN